jgi:hypothetical protein
VRGTSVERATPSSFDGTPLGGLPFLNYLRRNLAHDSTLAEAAWILQRAVFIGLGRRHDFEGISEASSFAPVVGAACYTFDPARVAEAKRIYGSVRDFTDSPDKVLDRK